MKNLSLILTLFFTCVVFGDTKISQLPVGTASTANANDSFPYVDSVHGITKRILLGDIQNLPTLQGAFILTQPIPANYVLAGPTSGADASPTSRLLVGADLPNPGASSKGGVESYSAVTHQWINTISTSGVPSSTQPAFTDVSGTAQPSQGGTGQTSLATAYAALYETIATAVGDLVYGGGSGAPTLLAGNITTTPKFLSQTGTGSASQAPSWIQPVCSNLSNAAASCSTDTTNAANISSGTLPAARLPNPSATTLGGIESYVAVSNQWINAISTSGVPSSTQPACGNLSNAAASCSTDATNATNITSGTLPAARLPNPSASTLGGIESFVAVTHQWIHAISTSGVPSATQPACADISDASSSCATDATNASNISSGTLNTARLPAAATFGTVNSVLGSVAVTGNTSGTVTIKPQAAAGTWEFDLPITAGASGSVLTSQGGAGAAMTWTTPLTNPMTTGGDIIYGGASGTPSRLANGTSGQVLQSAGGTSAPAWQTLAGNSTALKAVTVTKFTSTGTTSGEMFTVTSANATVGATYTNNSQTFTVLATISGATQLFTSGAGAPLASGTLTKATGTGDATITFSAALPLATYTTPTSPGPLHIRVRMVGGGGGGSGSGTTSSTGMTAGGSSFFGAGLLSCTGGLAGSNTSATNGGSGGTASLGSGPVGITVSGGQGGPTSSTVISASAATGGYGGGSFFGGAGAAGAPAAGGTAAAANSGSGGGGGGENAAASGTAGSGGGAGGFVDAIITGPSATYYYAVGAGGSAGSAGTSGAVGGAGAAGMILVEEYYQ